jgi:hypothetical protein
VRTIYQALREAGVRLGQPVACGGPDETPAGALRLCNSARLAVQALSDYGSGPEVVIDQALKALDAVAEAVRAHA